MNKSKYKSSNNHEYFSTDHLKSDLKRQAVRGAGATVFSQILGSGTQIIGAVILARLLIPEDFGLVAMVTAFSLLLQNFGVNGFTEAIIQQEVVNHKQISTLFWINVGFSLSLTLLFMASAPLIALFYKEPRLKSITIAISFSIIFAGMSTQHLALLKRQMRFYSTSANSLGSSLISVIIAITLAWWGWGYWAIVARRLSLPLITTVGAWILCPWRPGLPSLRTDVLPMLKFAVNTYGNFTMNYFSRNLDKILIGWRYSTQSLGYYDRAYHLFVMPVNQLSAPLASVSLATLSRLRNDPKKYHKYYLEAISILSFIGMPLSATLTLIGKDMILLLLGPQWSKAGQIFTVFGPAVGIMLIYSTNGWLHLSLGKADRWFRWAIMAFIVTALCFIIGLQFGTLGVAIAYSASFYILIGPCLWYAGKPIRLKLTSIVSTIWKYFVSALFAGLISFFILHFFDLTSNIFIGLNIFLRLLLSSFLCIIIYLILVVAFYRSMKPITRFISVLRDMMPNIL